MNVFDIKENYFSYFRCFVTANRQFKEETGLEEEVKRLRVKLESEREIRSADSLVHLERVNSLMLDHRKKLKDEQMSRQSSNLALKKRNKLIEANNYDLTNKLAKTKTKLRRALGKANEWSDVEDAFEEALNNKSEDVDQLRAQLTHQTKELMCLKKQFDDLTEDKNCIICMEKQVKFSFC